MIKLKKSIYDNYIDGYIDYCLNDIKNNFKKSSDIYFEGKVLRDDLFCKDGVINNDKIKKIILMNFDDLTQNDKILNDYFKTGLLIARTNHFVNEELKNLRSKNKSKKYKSLRKEFVDEYMNDWIESYFQNENVFKSNKSFLDVIENIENDYYRLTLIDDKQHIISYNLSSEFRNDFLSSLNISVCPYCNRQFISSFEKNNDEYQSTATLDHFYPKALFPLFSLSLYNLVPACHICNGILKNTSTRKIMYPFSKGYENYAHFRIGKFESLDSLLGNNDQFNIFVDYQKEKHEDIKNSIQLFKTEEIYKYHKDYVQSILLKSTIYSDTYKEMLKDLLKNKNLNYTEQGLNAFLYNLDLNDSEQTNVVLGRLTKDVLEQIEELKKQP